MTKTHTITRKGFRFQVDVEENGQHRYQYFANNFGELLERIATQALGYKSPQVSKMPAENNHELRNHNGILITEGRPRDLPMILEEIIRPSDVILVYKRPETTVERALAWIADEF